MCKLLIDPCVCSGVVEKGEAQKEMEKLEQFLNSLILPALKSLFGNITFVPRVPVHFPHLLRRRIFEPRG